MENLLTTTGLCYQYGQNRAVSDINITLNRGEILGLLGQNGAGKSTCLKMITGNLAPSSGRVAVEGIDLAQQPVAAKQRIGYLPDEPPLYADLRVDEYLAYCARLHRLPEHQIADSIEQVKQRCSLQNCGRRLIGNLSKGYRQRLGIAQAIIHDPPLIVLDEPTIGLDPVQINEVRELIRELGESHGIILSTHILPEAQNICHRVEILHQGRIVFSDRLTGNANDTISIQLEQPPALEQIAALPGIDSVRPLGGQCFLITARNGQRPDLARSLIEQEWGLSQFSPQAESLEQIFLGLARRE